MIPIHITEEYDPRRYEYHYTGRLVIEHSIIVRDNESVDAKAKLISEMKAKLIEIAREYDKTI